MAELSVKRLKRNDRTAMERLVKRWDSNPPFPKIIDTIARISVRRKQDVFMVIEKDYRDSHFDAIFATTRRELMRRYRLSNSGDNSPNKHLVRLHFFLGDCSQDKIAVDELNAHKDDYLGYCILCKTEGDQKRSVVDSLLEYERPYGEHGYFIELGKVFSCEIKDPESGEIAKLAITNAFPLVRQDGVLRCCGNVAVEMSSWALDPGQGPLCPGRQTQILKDLGFPYSIPITGLSTIQIEALAKDFASVMCFPYGTKSEKSGLMKEPVERLIYRQVESGFPVILVDLNCRHAIVIYGHNVNPNLWSEIARRTYFRESLKYYSASAWVTHFLATDDNFGMYWDLPVSYLQSKAKERGVAFFVITMIPKHYGRIGTSGYSAEDSTLGYVEDLVEALNTSSHASRMPENFSILVSHLKEKELVLRSQLVSKEKFLSQNKRLRGYQKLYRFYQGLDHVSSAMWLVEITTPELYVNYHACFGEFLFDASILETDSSDGLSFGHVPGLAIDFVGDKQVFLEKNFSYPMFGHEWEKLAKAGWAL